MREPLCDHDHVVVVGAGLAGWRFSEALRRDGYGGRLTLIGGESHLPYERPPLSKQILTGKWPIGHSVLTSRERLVELNINEFIGVPAVGLNAKTATVSLADGQVVAGSHVVIATGTRGRRLPFSAADELIVIRTLDDVERLVNLVTPLEPGSEILIIGGGFIGAEAATSLLARGFRPIVLEAMEMPLLNVVGHQVASWLSGLAADAGVELRTKQEVTDVVNDGDLLRVEFADGSSLRSPVVVLSVGAIPNTEWLDGSGLDTENGVVVDEFLLASNQVAAIGDVAKFRWIHHPFDEQVRIEHWQVANDHAQFLAKTLLQGSSGANPLSLLPYFWSDQYGKKIQMLGHPAASDDVRCLTGTPNEGRWLAVYSRNEVVTGLVSLNQARGLMLSKELVAEHVSLEEAIKLSPWSALSS